MKKATIPLIAKIEKTDAQLRSMLDLLTLQMQPLFDFEINATILEGDGVAIMREDGMSAPTGMGIDDVISVLRVQKRFTENDWNPSL